METHVILDTNAYVETNYGRSGKFVSLIDFLRKSGSKLVVLPSVAEEVLAKYDRDFRSQVETARTASRKAADISFSSRLHLLPGKLPDFPKEKEALNRTLSKVGKGVPVVRVEDSAVEVLEIVRRGARRIAPASSNGEELRDVIHWLLVLSYAKKTFARILFVSRDSGFWVKDNGPKEEILADVKNSGRQIKLFRDIDDLLKENSLSSAPLDAARATELFDIAQIESEIVALIGESLDKTEISDSVVKFRSGKLEASQFEQGTAFEIGKDSEFVEARFRIKAMTQIEFEPKKPSISFEVTQLLGRGPVRMLSDLSGVHTLPSVPPKPASQSLVPFEVTLSAELSTRVIDRQPGTPEVERIRFIE